MPSETPRDFKKNNFAETRNSILRDYKRDPQTVMHDNEALKSIHEENMFKNVVPSLKSLKLKGSFVSARGLDRRRGYGKKGRSTKEVAFDLDSNKGSQT